MHKTQPYRQARPFSQVRNEQVAQAMKRKRKKKKKKKTRAEKQILDFPSRFTYYAASIANTLSPAILVVIISFSSPLYTVSVIRPVDDWPTTRPAVQPSDLSSARHRLAVITEG